ncbi:MAG: MATE family efflux transporter [Hespellia sp.]|nr:MATE family efflux transporter [Hespellia sp.]
MTKNMTEGKPLRLILLFALPVLCGNLFQNFYNIVDSVIVGRFLGVNALAAVGSTTSLTFLVIGWVMGMTNGFGILIAQAFGAENRFLLKHYTAMSMYLCTILAIVMTGALLIANDSILHLINTPDTIFSDTSKYTAIIYAGVPVSFLYNMLASIARSLGDSKTPLYFLVISSLLNIALDFLFVAVLPFGVAGAAYATVIAQGVSAVLCLIYTWKKFPIIHFHKEEMKFSLRSAGNLFSMGVPMALQFSITAIGTMIVQSALNLLGATYIAAYAAASKIQSVIMQFFVALGSALATYTGQNYGAGKTERIHQGLSSSFIISIVYSIGVMTVAYFLCPLMVRLFVSDPTGELQQIATHMFHISLWFYPFLGLIFLYRNVLQGLGNGLIPMLGGVFELLARGLAVFLLAKPFGFTGICFSDPAAWIFALIPLIPYYYWWTKRKNSPFQEIEKA